MELKETVELMNSSDYKERFKAEYLQAKIRYDKLHKMLEHSISLQNVLKHCFSNRSDIWVNIFVACRLELK